MSGDRLGDAVLAGLPAAVARPRYDRRSLPAGVVHLGVGNFFRAHAAVCFDARLAAGDRRWGVCGVNLHSTGVRDALVPQQGLYTVIERDGGGPRARVVGALAELLAGPGAAADAIARIGRPTTHWVTLTITEKGYVADPARGTATAVGLLHAGLVGRRAAGVRTGLTVVSCDNLTGNGRRLAARIREHDAASGGVLAGWLDDHVRFPCTMVDRIVPATRDADRDDARRLLGVGDAWPVPAEPFTQWVIEDDFAGERPALEDEGVQIVADVAPWETMKLALLNTAHSCLAYLGAPAGLATVDAAIGAPALARFVDRLWRDEVVPMLPALATGVATGVANDYCARLRRRFANPGIAHATAQIAIDGSQKLAMRWVPTIRARRAAGLPCPAFAMAVAGWVRWLGGEDEAGGRHPVVDPLAGRLQARLRGAGDAAARARAVVGERAVFEDLGDDAVFVADVGRALGLLETRGTIAALDAAR